MRLENGCAWLEIADAYGPRVTGFGREAGRSVFGDGAGVGRDTPAGRWRAYGGHRLWVAPERFPETYRIDDDPPQIVAHGERGATVRRAADALGFASEITLELDAHAPDVVVTHVIANEGSRDRQAAPWALTIMASGGRAIVPREPPRTHAEALTPTGMLSLWAYARFDDARVSWERDALVVRCDPAAASPWKIGASGEPGWCAYVSGATAFVKRFDVAPGASYPDRGCALEAFTDGPFFELETLAPLQRLAPGSRAQHVERWSLVALAEDRDAVEQIAEWLEGR